MRDFKVGDRVIGIEDYDARTITGVKGTIYRIADKRYYVCWDKDIRGSDDPFDSGCKPGHSWYVEKENIKLLRPPKGRFDRDMVVEDIINESVQENICKILKKYDVVIIDHDNVSDDKMKEYLKIIKDCGYVYYGDVQNNDNEGHYIFRWWKNVNEGVAINISDKQVEYASVKFYEGRKSINMKDVIKKAKLFSKGRFDREMVVEAKNPNFKVDDRVIGIGSYDGKNINGLKGTIETVSKDEHGNVFYVTVCWDEDIGGHKGDYDGCERGHGWNVSPRNIKLDKPKGRFDREMVIENLNEDYDSDKVKKELPKVRVMFDGQEYEGYIRSNETEFAYVRISDFPGTKFKFSWETIADSLNRDFALET
jgi:hypothetical protein